MLNLLDTKPMTGYELMSEIEGKLGSRPSPGSMYPLLEDMRARGMVVHKASGRRKIYSITSKGRKSLSLINEKKKEILEKVHEGLVLLENVFGTQDNMFYRIMLESMMKDKVPFRSLNPELSQFRRLLVKNEDADLKKTKQIKAILKETIKKIRALG